MAPPAVEQGQEHQHQQNEEQADRAEVFPARLDWRNFKIVEKVGEGTTGHVYKALDAKTNTLVALKVFPHNSEGVSVSALQEIKSFKRLRSLKYIVRLLGYTFTDKDDFVLVEEYMDHDLAGLLRSKRRFTEPQIKCIMQQLVAGLDECHRLQLIHRDIKSSNILMHAGNLRITDFGFMTTVEAARQRQQSEIVTLWYRSPELLLGTTSYGQEVDIWSAGCIFFELLMEGEIAFSGRNPTEQLNLIFKTLGKPTEATWPGVQALPLWDQMATNIFAYKSTLDDRLGRRVSRQARDLLASLLSHDPKRRPTAAEALSHPFFTHGVAPCLPSELPLHGELHDYVKRKAEPPLAMVSGAAIPGSSHRHRMSHHAPGAVASSSSSGRHGAYTHNSRPPPPPPPPPPFNKTRGRRDDDHHGPRHHRRPDSPSSASKKRAADEEDLDWILNRDQASARAASPLVFSSVKRRNGLVSPPQSYRTELPSTYTSKSKPLTATQPTTTTTTTTTTKLSSFSPSLAAAAVNRTEPEAKRVKAKRSKVVTETKRPKKETKQQTKPAKKRASLDAKRTELTVKPVPNRHREAPPSSSSSPVNGGSTNGGGAKKHVKVRMTRPQFTSQKTPPPVPATSAATAMTTPSNAAKVASSKITIRRSKAEGTLKVVIPDAQPEATKKRKRTPLESMDGSQQQTKKQKQLVRMVARTSQQGDTVATTAASVPPNTRTPPRHCKPPLHKHKQQKTQSAGMVKATARVPTTVVAKKQPVKSSVAPPSQPDDQCWQIGCDWCQGWYMMEDEGISPEEGKRIELFKCRRCRGQL